MLKRAGRRDSAARGGLYLEIYHATLSCQGRMAKIGRAVQDGGIVSETHLVGIGDVGEDDGDDLGAGVRNVCFIVPRIGLGHLGRAIRVLTWYYRVFSTYAKQPVSVVAAHSVWVLPLSWLLARRTRAHLIYNCHELETETVSLSGVRQRVAKAIERWFIKRCEVVSVVNEPIADWYETEYSMPRPVVVGNPPAIRQEDEGLREKLGIDDAPLLFIHTGHLVIGRSIPAILDAFRGSDHHVVFLGDGEYRAQIEEAHDASPNIHWLAPVPHDRVVSHVREADVALSLIEGHHALSIRLSSPNKLMEGLAAGIPVLCTDLPEPRRLLGEFADEWIIADPQVDLRPALARITRERTEAFKRAWPGIKPWEREVAPLVAAIEELFVPASR